MTGLVTSSLQAVLTLENENKEAILRMDNPQNAIELNMFMGCVNYYHNIWPSHAHVLKPLINYSSLKIQAPMPWIDKMQKEFDRMHVIMMANALAAYSRHSHQCI